MSPDAASRHIGFGVDRWRWALWLECYPVDIVKRQNDRLVRLKERAEAFAIERDVQKVIELSPNVAMALIAGAQEESREELMELWARLFANAMDPSLNSVRQSFIEAVKRIDRCDAVVLRYFHQESMSAISIRTKEPNNREFGIDKHLRRNWSSL